MKDYKFYEYNGIENIPDELMQEYLDEWSDWNKNPFKATYDAFAADEKEVKK